MIRIVTKCTVFKVPSAVVPDEVKGNHAMYSRRISLNIFFVCFCCCMPWSGSAFRAQGVKPKNYFTYA